MALPITIPYTFANATSSIPLSNLDNDFTVVVNAINGIANGTNALANVNIIGGTIDNVAIGATTPANGTFTNLVATNSNVGTVTAGTWNGSVVDVVHGGTNSASLTLNNVILGNGTGTVKVVAPGTTGNVLVSNGTSWISSAASGGGTPGGSNTQVQYNSSGTFAGSANLTFDGTNLNVGGTVAMSSSFKRNRIINGNCAVDQRNAGAAQTITAGAALAYTVDRSYAYCTGANVTGQQVAGATANQYRYQFTGAASVTAINFAQRIEALNCADLAGTTATFSVDLANSLLTTVTWTAYYANTTNTFGTLASPTVTSIATGTFTVSSTVTRYNAQIAIPSAATTGLQIVLSVGAQTSGTWTIGNVQLEAGSIATPYERKIYSDQLLQCQRYFQQPTAWTGMGDSTTGISAVVMLSPPMRAAPTMTGISGSTLSWRSPGADNTSTSWTLAAVQPFPNGAWVLFGNLTTIVAGSGYQGRYLSGGNYILNASAEL